MPCSSNLLQTVLIMLLLLRAHFHRRSHTTATGSACSGDNATNSCAAASHTASQPQSQRTPCATALTRVHSRHRRLVVRVQWQRPASHAVHAPAVLHWHKMRIVPGHERHRVVGVGTVKAGEAPALGVAGIRTAAAGWCAVPCARPTWTTVDERGREKGSAPLEP